MPVREWNRVGWCSRTTIARSTLLESETGRSTQRSAVAVIAVCSSAVVSCKLRRLLYDAARGLVIARLHSFSYVHSPSTASSAH